jgi:hypothetical protein
VSTTRQIELASTSSSKGNVMTANQKHAPSPRRGNSLKLWLLSAALLATLVGYLEVKAGQHGSRHAVAAGDGRADGPLHRLATKLEREAGIDLPEEYRAIRPAGVDGAAPSIPPSETWPSQ